MEASTKGPPLRKPGTVSKPRRPPWFDESRTEHLAKCLPPIASTSDEETQCFLSETLSAGWIDSRITVLGSTATKELFVTERPKMSKAEYETMRKAIRSNKRAKTSLSSKAGRKKRVKNDVGDEQRRVFALRVAPTRAQKLYFQRAITIACLAKKLAYKYLGDQRIPMTSARMLRLRSQICTEMASEMEETDEVDPATDEKIKKIKGGRKKKRKLGQTEGRNEFLPLPVWRRLFEHRLEEENAAKKDHLTNRWKKQSLPRGVKRKKRTAWTVPLRLRPVHSDVRRNAVISFCRAVHATQAGMEEKAMTWDEQWEEHRRWLDLQRRVKSLAANELTVARASGERLTKAGSRKRAFSMIPEKEKKLAMRKTPPKGQRPALKPRQVKPPDCNAASHSFEIDAVPRNPNPYSVRWDVGGPNCGFVRFMGLDVPLWGCPSKRRREIQRLSSRLPDDQQLGSLLRVTLRYSSGGRYHLLVQCPIGPEQPKCYTTAPLNAVALDPGVRTFFGLFDTKGRFGEIGEGQIGRIIRKAKRADRVKSRLDTKLRDKDHRDHNSAKRKRARRRLRQLATKCRDLKADAHWKVARALCENYDHVLIPKFHCSTMMRFLARSSTRQLMHWGHYEFRQRLQHKAQQLGVRVHVTKENHTSVTCGRCLWIEESFRGNSAKLFQCRKCGHTVDRDRNGAYNIMLMNLEKCVGRVEPMVTNQREVIVIDD